MFTDQALVLTSSIPLLTKLNDQQAFSYTDHVHTPGALSEYDFISFKYVLYLSIVILH